jgi:hypothetical protein
VIGINIFCNFCDEKKWVPLTPEGVLSGMSGYLAHMVESHWDKLEEGRAARLATGVPVDDAWTRI